MVTKGGGALRIGELLEAIFGIGTGEIRAIVELHTLAQGEGDLRAVRGNLPALGQVAHDLLMVIHVERQQAVVDRANGLRGDIGALVMNVKVRHALMYRPDNGPASVERLSRNHACLIGQDERPYHQQHPCEPPASDTPGAIP